MLVGGRRKLKSGITGGSWECSRDKHRYDGSGAGELSRSMQSISLRSSHKRANGKKQIYGKQRKTQINKHDSASGKAGRGRGKRIQ